MDVRKIKKGNQVFEYNMLDRYEKNMFFRDIENGFKEYKK